MQILFSLRHVIFMFLRSSSTPHCLLLQLLILKHCRKLLLVLHTTRYCLLVFCTCVVLVKIFLVYVYYAYNMFSVEWMLLISSCWCISTHFVHFLSISLDILFSLYLITSLLWNSKGILLPLDLLLTYIHLPVNSLPRSGFSVFFSLGSEGGKTKWIKYMTAIFTRRSHCSC